MATIKGNTSTTPPAVDWKADPQAVSALVDARHGDPFGLLGMHGGGDAPLVVRTFQPGAQRVQLHRGGRKLVDLERTHDAGFFEGLIEGESDRFPYQLEVAWPSGTFTLEDPYRFAPVLGELDLHLLSEGTHLELYRKLGAHPLRHEDVDGVSFAVWAPDAKRVSVVGTFNNWDGRRHAMRRRFEAGIWEIFIPSLARGDLYKFEIVASDGSRLPLKADPMALAAEMRPSTASIVHGMSDHEWADDEWMQARQEAQRRDAPISVYEVHLGSWQRVPEEGDRYLTYRELADRLIPYVADMGFTHIECLPVSEYPFDGSWGYQPIGLFAPTSRFGTPEDFAYFVDRAHAHGVGVILDWVPGHFPTDSHGLGQFDGTALYEHADPRQGFHLDWNTLIYNYGRTEVANFLHSNALFWGDQFHVDGLRVDAVASMLYLNYSRDEGGWIPNKYGGNENLEAIAFLKRMNELVYGAHPGAVTIAEESTAWPSVSRPVYLGGLGFGFKWNMGWMHDTLNFISKDPIHRKYHLHDLTFGLVYAFSENFVLPISHDEVVHGKGSLINKMPGDEWQKFANLRTYLTFMWTHPGKKLLFMGCEFGQWREWNHDTSLDWHLLDAGPLHVGLQRLVRDLNHAFRSRKALHELDCEPEGFEWIDCTDTDNVVVSYLRKSRTGDEAVVVVLNFTPLPRDGYRIGVPEHGRYREIINSDAGDYGGSGFGNGGMITSEEIPQHGRPASLALKLPPLGALILEMSAE